MSEEVKNAGNALKIWAWVFIILNLLTPLSGIGSVICSMKYKKYNQTSGSILLIISIIVMVVAFAYRLMKIINGIMSLY